MVTRAYGSRALELVLAACAGWLALSPAPDASPARQDLVVARVARPGMGTIFQVSVAARGRPRAELTRVMTAALDEMERLEALFSEWRPGTEISEVNRLAGIAGVRVSPDTFRALAEARRISALTGGAFDVTFNALWGLWDFKATPPRLPEPAEVARRVALIDYRRLELEPSRRTVRLERAGMKVGLGGIGQGIAVDRICERLEQAGLPDHVVDGGGDVKVCGSRGTAAWTVGIRHPRRDALLCTVDVSERAVVTSGDYERFFVVDGRRYHHIMDPLTGYPARGAVSATVIARSATQADALATAVFVMGAARGLALLERLPGVEGLIVDDALRTHLTRGLVIQEREGELPVLRLSAARTAR